MKRDITQQIIDSIGMRMGKRVLLNIAEPAYYDRGNGKMFSQRRVLVRCDCGKETKVAWYAFKEGLALTCRSC